MAASSVRLMFLALLLALVTFSSGQAPMGSPPMAISLPPSTVPASTPPSMSMTPAMAPSMEPMIPVTRPPEMAHGPSMTTQPASPGMSPEMASQPAPLVPGAPETAPAAPANRDSRGFMQESSIAMVAFLGSVAFLV